MSSSASDGISGAWYVYQLQQQRSQSCSVLCGLDEKAKENMWSFVYTHFDRKKTLVGVAMEKFAYKILLLKKCHQTIAWSDMVSSLGLTLPA